MTRILVLIKIKFFNLKNLNREQQGINFLKGLNPTSRILFTINKKLIKLIRFSVSKLQGIEIILSVNRLVYAYSTTCSRNKNKIYSQKCKEGVSINAIIYFSENRKNEGKPSFFVSHLFRFFSQSRNKTF